ncbi:helix-turn-helix domain-containing protein [[Haemophilus] felis]|uniref:Transcriptional regulator n=1 Tax=[Haemophilus] felis TaxID=123822 RepID=A0A1T0B027_9PAST|nr:helix-turn-helix domain-containing protein [[Haemophilus] felis]NBI41553.1 helix-turn-helix domain-containing protein [[Haemophilus] felis]OOS03518.1 transcriptional regulator [[Haemophilus] felis]
MSTHDNIRLMREKHKWSQEEMAEKLNMSPSGYSKIERGETKLYLDKLQQIAQIFNIDISELVNSNEKNICFLIGENSHLNSNFYANDEALALENEKLKLSLSYKDQIIAEKDAQIASLKEIITLLKTQSVTDE